jgi:hypothetical protein
VTGQSFWRALGDLLGRKLEIYFGRPDSLTGEDEGHSVVLRGFNLMQDSHALTRGEVHTTARDRTLLK